MARFKFGKKKKHLADDLDLSSMDQHLLDDSKNSHHNQLPLHSMQQAPPRGATTPQQQYQPQFVPSPNAGSTFNSPKTNTGSESGPSAGTRAPVPGGNGYSQGRSLENLHGNGTYGSQNPVPGPSRHSLYGTGLPVDPLGFHNSGNSNGNGNGGIEPGIGNGIGNGYGNANQPPQNSYGGQQNLKQNAGNTPWERFKLFNSPFPRYRHAAASVASEKGEVFVMGGLKDGEVFGDTWKIVPQEGSQHQVQGYVAKNIEVSNKNNPPARVGHSVVLCGNAFIVFGGDTVDTDEKGFPDNNFYLFNINNNKYTIPSHILNKPCGRYGHAVGAISLNNSSSRLYLFGGQLENNVFDDMYYFELNSFKSQDASWKLISPLNNFKPPPLTNHSMSVYKNKIYVFGGVYNNERVSNDLWCFDVLIDKWSQVPTTGNIPSPVNEHSACVVGEKLYVFGGNDFSGVIYDSLYVLNLHTFVWSKISLQGERNGPGPRCGHSMTYIPKFNRILIMGGEKNDYVSADPNDFEVYDEYDETPVGTMIYELNLDTLDQFLTSTPIPTKARDEIQSTSIPGPPPGGPRKMAASAVYANPNESKLSHGRNASEDFRTPNASPVPQHAVLAAQPDISEIHPQVSPPPVTEGQFPDHRLLDSQARAIVNPQSDFAPPPQDFVEVDVDTSEATSVAEGDISTRRGSAFDSPKVVKEPHSGSKVLPVVPPPVVRPNRMPSDTETESEDEMDEEFRKSKIVQPPVKTGAPAHVAVPAVAAAATAATAAATAGVLASGSNSSKSPVSRSIRQADADDSPETPKMSGSEAGAVKKLISELTAELTQLKHSTKVQMQEATEKIVNLEKERDGLQEKAATHQAALDERDAVISELKEAVDPKSLVVNDYDETSAKNVDDISLKPRVGDATKFKLANLELNNKLVYLEDENRTLNDKLVKFEPFMKHQIAELSTFQKIIKNQEDKIASLTEKVRDQESLHKSINEWKSKYEDLELEFNNFKAIHDNEEIEVEDDFITDNTDVTSDNDATNRSLMSTVSKRTKKDISLQLESLVNLWSNVNHDQVSGDKSVAGEGSGSMSKNDVVSKLQAQVDDLLRVGKSNELNYQGEIDELKQELYARQESLKQIEDKYKEAIQSVNNTSKALKMNQDEASNQRALLEKLTKENNELLLFKKASKRVSSRGGFGGAVQDHEILTIDEDDEDADEHERIATAHYTMKIKDLEADLYILKQERDQLKENVTQLQKQLYLAANSD